MPIPKRAALVTGGAKRIGQAICLKLADLGFDIALHYNQSQNEALETAQYIRKKGRVCELFSCDLANQQETSLLIKAVYKTFPSLNLLVNNASVFEPSTLKKASLEAFNRELNINLKAPLVLTRDFANICGQGQIINLLDTNIAQNQTSHFIYLLTKKNLHELTKMSAVELAPQIRVNAIAPGFILPPAGKGKEGFKKLEKNIPLKRQGNVLHITQALEFLIKNNYLSGEVIFVDGGKSLWPQSA